MVEQSCPKAVHQWTVGPERKFLGIFPRAGLEHIFPPNSVRRNSLEEGMKSILSKFTYGQKLDSKIILPIIDDTIN